MPIQQSIMTRSLLPLIPFTKMLFAEAKAKLKRHSIVMSMKHSLREYEAEALRLL